MKTAKLRAAHYLIISFALVVIAVMAIYPPSLGIGNFFVVVPVKRIVL